MIIKPFGESALLVEFESEISEAIHHQVISLKRTVEKYPEVFYTIPAYQSLTVVYNKSQAQYGELKKKITESSISKYDKVKSRHLKIPVCYDHAYAPDLKEVAKELKTNTNWVVEQHIKTVFKVYMLGFSPGFAYMGKFLKSVNRKSEPRKKIPANSVGLAGEQTGIYPNSSPGGWQIIGRTPIPVFDPQIEDPFLFRPGDTVNFYNISLASFEKLELDYKKGNITWEFLHG